MDEVLGTLGSIWNMLVQFLGGFLDLIYLGPLLLFAIIALVLNPRGPSAGNNLIASVIFATPAVFFLGMMFRATVTDSTIFAFIVLAAGMVWIFMDIQWQRNKVGKIVAGVMAMVAFSAIIGTAAAYPGGGFMPDTINQAWAGLVGLKDRLFGSV